MDENYCLRWVNFGRSSTGWDVVLHPDDLQNCIAAWTTAYTTGAPYELENRLKRASDGVYRWHLSRALPVRDDCGNVIKWFGTCTDIHDQKEALCLVARTVQERTAELASVNHSLLSEIERRKLDAEAQQRDTIRLNEIITTQCQLAAAELDLDAFLKLVVYRMDALTPAAGSVVELVEGDEMVYRAASGVAAGHIGLRLNVSTSISGLCVKSQQVLRADDTETDERVDRAACRRLNIRSLVVAPLFHEGKTIGALKAMAIQPRAFGGRDVQTLQLMAGLVASAIAHQSAFDANQRLLDELRVAVEAIQSNEQRIRTVIDSAFDAFIRINADGVIRDWNQQAELTFGWTRDEAVGQTISQLIIPERFREAHLAGMTHFHHTGEGPILNRRIELQGIRRDGREFPLELAINVLKNGDRYEFCAFLHDITDRKNAEAALLLQAQFDPLTGLANRRMFDDRLTLAMERSRRTHKSMALMYLDIDHFKEINDRLGHIVGDGLLQEFAHRLEAGVRAVDTVARLGGDEFVVIMEEINEPIDPIVITEKIMQCIRAEFSIETQKLNVTASLGGVFYRGEIMSEKELVVLADQSLYKAKETGRNIGVWANQWLPT